jgi:hypothetical protein
MTEVVIIFGKMKIILRNFFLIINFVRDWTKTALLHSTTLQWIMTNKKEGNKCLVFLQDLPQNHAYLFSQKSRLPWLRLCKWDEIIQLVIFSHQTYILKVLLRLLLWLLRYHQNPFPDQCPTLSSLNCWGCAFQETGPEQFIVNFLLFVLMFWMQYPSQFLRLWL